MNKFILKIFTGLILLTFARAQSAQIAQYQDGESIAEAHQVVQGTCL